MTGAGEDKGGDVFRRWAEDAPKRPTGTGELIPAATVIVVRDGTDGLETLMLRRNSKLEFAGGMWVFPGGRIDDGDRHAGDHPDDELAPARRAAVREAKEEADIEVDHEGLVVYSHWQPPEIAPKRFSTWFFLGASPGGTAEDVTIDDGEIKDHAWLRPDVALARRDALEVELAPPTWVTLFELSRFADVASALSGTADRPPEKYTTHIAMVDGGVVALWHGDAGYEDQDPEAGGSRHRLHMLQSGWRYERTTP